MIKCLCCQINTNNLKYCSKSCAAKINNKLVPKRSVEKQNLCKICNTRLSRYKGQRTTNLCQKCFFDQKTKNSCLKTKEEMICKSYKSIHKYEKIRQHAKRYAKQNKWIKDECEKCGYNKHVELCHISSIASFPNSALLLEINGQGNIIFLCPNCHWELDNL